MYFWLTNWANWSIKLIFQYIFIYLARTTQRRRYSGTNQSFTEVKVEVIWTVLIEEMKEFLEYPQISSGLRWEWRKSWDIIQRIAEVTELKAVSLLKFKNTFGLLDLEFWFKIWAVLENLQIVWGIWWEPSWKRTEMDKPVIYWCEDV